jgi:S-formylglutathione hydrolase FrmB
VLLLLVVGTLPRAATATPTAVSTAATVLDDQVIGGDPRLHELTLQSPALGRATKVRVLLPAGYDDPTNAITRYPVLLLLHGVGDDQASWTNRTDVAAFTASTPLIVVMPDAGKTPTAGWYSDWIDGPAWESFHIGELLPFVDATYRTMGTRESRAVAGFSMGGFGAMSYAARHPELFVAAAEFSGAVDTTFAGQGEATALELLSTSVGTPSDNVWGPYATNEARWRTHNPSDLAENLRWTDLWLVSGNGVPRPGDNPQAGPVETGVYIMNLRFHSALVERGIAHVWNDRGYGTHDWPYRQLDLHTWVPQLLTIFAAPPPPPAAFDYRSAEPGFSAWGWEFDTDRPGLQFVDLTGVSAAGFTVSGSGPLRVVSPPVYPPGSTQRITAVNGSAIDVLADNDRRLRFTVDLGPGRAAAQSPLLGVQVDTLGRDERVTRTIAITDISSQVPSSPTGDATRARAGGAAELPASGGGGLGWAGAALLAATAAARWCRSRALPRAR